MGSYRDGQCKESVSEKSGVDRLHSDGCAGGWKHVSAAAVSTAPHITVHKKENIYNAQTTGARRARPTCVSFREHDKIKFCFCVFGQRKGRITTLRCLQRRRKTEPQMKTDRRTDTCIYQLFHLCCEAQPRPLKA